MSGRPPIPRCRQCGDPRYDAHSKQGGLCRACKKTRMTEYRKRKALEDLDENGNRVVLDG